MHLVKKIVKYKAAVLPGRLHSPHLNIVNTENTETEVTTSTMYTPDINTVVPYQAYTHFINKLIISVLWLKALRI